MKKHLFLTAAALLLAACSADVAKEEPQAGSGTFTATARLNTGADDDTKLEYTSDGAKYESFDIVWSSSDLLYCYDASTGMFLEEAANPAIYSDDQTKADWTFSSIAKGTTFYAYINDSGSLTQTSFARSATTANTFSLDLSSQDGTAANVNHYNLLRAKGTATGGPIDLNFKHLTSIIKLNLVLPETFSAASAVTVTLSGTGLINNITELNYDGTAATYETGDIVAADIAPANNTVTAYLAVWPCKATDIKATVSSGTLTHSFDLGSKKIKSGYVYTAGYDAEVRNITKTVTDDADADNFYTTATATSSADWLSFDDNKVSWAENTSGAPRQAVLTFSNGSTYSVTQMEEKDFAGDWTLVTYKLFTATTGSSDRVTPDTRWGYTSSTPPTSVTYGAVVDGEDYGNATPLTISYKSGKTVSAADGFSNAVASHTNNLLVKGLYENLKVEAWAEVDYEEQEATIGLFIDTSSDNKAQLLTTGIFAGNYATLMPELKTKGSTYSNYTWRLYFARIGSSSNYFWYMGSVTVEGDTTTVRWAANDDESRQNLYTSTGYDIWGLQVFRYTGTAINATNLIRQGTSSTSNAAYAVTYQGDIVMTKTGGSTQTIDAGGDAQ